MLLMNSKDYIIKYIKGNGNDTYDFLKSNSLLFLCENFGYGNDRYSKQNELNYLYNQKIIFCLTRKLNDQKISYIAFKGICLSEMLYDDPTDRKVGDIDIYIDFENHNRFINALNGMGMVMENEECDYAHHIGLTNGKAFIELHKHILNPFTNIDETYLKKNTTVILINKMPIITFSLTATLLHLIYHLYMDTYLSAGSLYNIFANKTIPKANRFLYRAYEIALFSEKYYNQIKWKDIIEDIKKQKLRIFFKKMIMDILEIFPNTFPESFIDTVFQHEYIEDERDQLYKFLINAEIKTNDNIDSILSDYIDINRDKRMGKNIHKKSGESILLTKKSEDGENEDISCNVETKKTTEGLRIIFKVSNSDLSISEINDYNTLGSDGVHLLLCGTEKYSYKSIFFFPKLIDDEIKIVVCDVLNNKNTILGDDLINADFYKTDNNYTIIANIKNRFLEENHLKTYFYMGLVISDCNSETHYRKNQLILSEIESYWYNPVYFARIDMQ